MVQYFEWQTKENENFRLKLVIVDVFDEVI